MEITPELASIHAHVCGDGYVYISKEKRSAKSLISHPRKNLNNSVWVIAYCNTCKPLIDEFNSDIIKSFNRHGTYIEKKFELRVRGAKHIMEKLDLIGKGSYTWFIPDFIINSSNEIRLNWLKAFFDDEAYFKLKKKAIIVETVNGIGMKQISDMLTGFGIQNSFYFIKSKNTWRVAIYRNNVVTYKHLISPSHPKKKENLEKIVGRVGIS